MAIKLEDAVAVVQKEIRKWREKYESVAKTEEQDPIMVEGETSTGYYCQLMADPKDVAKFLSITTMRFIMSLTKTRRTLCGKI